MKRLLAVALFFFSISIGFADEVGNGIVVDNPKAEPIYVKSDGSRKVWKCEGLVNTKLLDAIFDDISQLSKMWSLPNPNRALCLYSLYSNEFSPGVKFTNVRFSTGDNSASTCELNASCPTQISVRLMSIKGENYRSYTTMRTSGSEQKFFGACSKLNGTILSDSKACMELGL